MALSPLEKSVSKLQIKLIDRPSLINDYLDDEIIKGYSNELAAKFFPRAKNEIYLESAAELFAIDLIVAPYLHSRNYLWRYNYDDLDILANFYKFSNSKHKYFFATYRLLPKPDERKFRENSKLLKVNLSDERIKLLFDLYESRGTRSQIAKRIVEQISFVKEDTRLNSVFHFADAPSKRNRLAGEIGKFRYLRRGRELMIIGTKPNNVLTDIREKEVEVFDYSIRFTRDNEVSVCIRPKIIRELKSELNEILNRESSIFFRLKLASETYQRFFHRHRFANRQEWKVIDFWFKGKAHAAMQAYPKLNFELFSACENKKPPVFLPRRSNFFWNPAEELNCQFSTVWSPYNS
jgi:hypothetical protein